MSHTQTAVTGPPLPAPKEASNRKVARRSSRAQFLRNEDCKSRRPPGNGRDI